MKRKTVQLGVSVCLCGVLVGFLCGCGVRLVEGRLIGGGSFVFSFLGLFVFGFDSPFWLFLFLLFCFSSFLFFLF